MDKPFLDELCASACHATHSEHSLLFLYQENRELQPVAGHGQERLAESEYPSLSALAKALLSNAAGGAQEALDAGRPAELGEWRAAIVSDAAGQAIGLLCIRASSPRAPTRDEAAVLAAQASAIGQALHAAQLGTAATRLAFDILELVPLPALLVSRDGRIRRANFAAEGFFGQRKADLAGKALGDLGTEAALQEPGAVRILPRTRLGTGPFRIDTWPGEARYCEIGISPLPTVEDGLCLYTFLDCTDKLSADHARERIHEALLRESDAEFHAFSAQSISEEIRPTLLIIGTLSKDRRFVEALSSHVKGRPGGLRRLDLAQLPCASLLVDREKTLLSGLAACCPESPLVADLHLQSFVGLRLHSSTGDSIGLLFACFDHELSRRGAEACLQVLRNYSHAIAGRIKKAESSDIIAKLTSSVQHSPHAVVITDKNGIIEYTNPSFNQITGYQEDECIGVSTRINSSGKNHKSLYRAMWKNILKGEQWEGELLNRKKNGSLYWTRTKIFPLRNAAGEIANFVSIQEDITQEKAAIEQLRHEASHDALTQLLNRAEFRKQLLRAIDSARAERCSHALCFIDLDQFKMINDTCGHFAGDILLTRVSDIIKAHIRKSDIAARLGGDEFTIIMHDCPLSAATQTARAIHDRIAAIGFTWLGKTYGIGSCMGITKIDGLITGPDELLRQADYACYTGKNKGRNAIEVFQRSTASLRQMKEGNWIPEITGAMKAGRLTLFCQAIAPLTSLEASLDRQSCYYEVLIRMKSRGRRLISPASFLPAVERYSLSPKLDRYVVDKVFAFIDRHLTDIQSLSAGLAINLSGSSLHDAQLLAFILKKLDGAKLAKNQIRFEITETAAIANIQHARHFMESIRERGSLVCLDDFGSGLSSFGYLKSLPIDILKIDGELIKGIVEDKSDFAIVKTINEMAHSLGYQTVGEYVESREILDCLREIGVDYGQGYAIHRPAPLAASRNALLKS